MNNLKLKISEFVLWVVKKVDNLSGRIHAWTRKYQIKIRTDICRSNGFDLSSAPVYMSIFTEKGMTTFSASAVDYVRDVKFLRINDKKYVRLNYFNDFNVDLKDIKFVRTSDKEMFSGLDLYVKIEEVVKELRRDYKLQNTYK